MNNLKIQNKGNKGKKNQCEGEYTGGDIRITYRTFTDDMTALSTGESTTTLALRLCYHTIDKEEKGWDGSGEEKKRGHPQLWQRHPVGAGPALTFHCASPTPAVLGP
jgi:hypothetical protein